MAIEKIRTLRGRPLPLRGDNIDTDRIIPARFLKAITFEGLEAHVFEDDRLATADHPLSNSRYAGASVLVVNENFGCGSSREHAPQAIRRYGFSAIVGESFSEIFFGNSVALGLPCLAAAPDDVEVLMAAAESNPAEELEIDLDRMVVTSGGRTIRVTLPAAARESFLSGTWDATALLLDDGGAVERVAARLPYITGW